MMDKQKGLSVIENIYHICKILTILFSVGVFFLVFMGLVYYVAMTLLSIITGEVIDLWNSTF